MTRPSLRVRYHQGTTAHTSSIYPFSVQGSFGHRGTYVGLDLLAGGGEFCWDPFEAYATGLVTNPNGWILGEPGNGKSALVKCLLWRQAAIYGTGPGGRWTAIADPKGEYATLAEHLGLTVVKLSPVVRPRSTRSLPDPQPTTNPRTSRSFDAPRCAPRSSAPCSNAASPSSRTPSCSPRSTSSPPHPSTNPRSPTSLGSWPTRPRRWPNGFAAPTAILAVDTARSRTPSTSSCPGRCAACSTGRSTVPLRWDGPGVVLDLSAVPLDSDALPLVMVAAAGWFQQLMACPGPQRVQILDEAWALLGNRHTAGYLQTSFKLGRTYGVANLCITHRASDLVAQADDGTATSKIAAGLLADSRPRSSFARPPTSSTPRSPTSGSPHPKRPSSASSPEAARCGSSEAEPRSSNTSSVRASSPSSTPTPGCTEQPRLSGPRRREPCTTATHSSPPSTCGPSPTTSLVIGRAVAGPRCGRARTLSTRRADAPRRSASSPAAAASNGGAATAVVTAEPPSTSSSPVAAAPLATRWLSSPNALVTASSPTSGAVRIGRPLLGPSRRADAVIRRVSTATSTSAPNASGSPKASMRQWLIDARGLPREVLVENRIGADLGPRVQQRPDGMPRAAGIVLPVIEGGHAVYAQIRIPHPRSDARAT
jgi:hypothetical protein